MTGPIPFDEHADRLKIRAKPKPVTRLNRKVLLAGSALGILALFAAMSIALKPPVAYESNAAPERYNTANTRKPDALAALPASYSDLGPDTIPNLGAPLPGDLGATVLGAERRYGLGTEAATEFEEDFLPDPADEAIRARRLSEAKREEEAAGAPVFYRLQSAGAARSDALLTRASASEQEERTRSPNATSSAARDDSIYNPFTLEQPASPYQVMSGTLIPASLVTGIHSDLPGMIVAQVTQDVRDTVTGTHLLIPQGVRLIGRYASSVSFGQDRVLITWERIIFSDGSSLRIDAPGTDAEGQSGIAGKTDHHWDRIAAAAGLATLLEIGAESSLDDNSDIARAIERGFGDTLNTAGQRIVERDLAIKPTIRIKPGASVNVMVTRDLILEPQS